MFSYSKLRLLFLFNLLLVLTLIGYKIYLNFFERDFTAIHSQQVEKVEQLIDGRDSYSFAVIGNINNSVGVFERKIIPMLNHRDIDFVISAGNAVNSGGEDKYRAIHRTLSHLDKPYLLTFGENEYSRLGSFRFYDHFGPYLFSFAAGNSRFIFLDSTGKTSFSWQLRWLEEELANASESHKFVFSGHPLQPVNKQGILDFDEEYLFDVIARSSFTRLIEQAGVDAVFSANLPLYSRQRHKNTDYILTGGAGGLVLNNRHSYYHYVEVRINGNSLEINPVRLDVGQHPAWRTVESLWFFVHSVFYVGYLNFLILVSGLIVISIWLNRLIFSERDYYPNFNLDPEPFLKRPFKVAMFTNNYLPFIGGVPISIERLRQGLQSLGHTVSIIAPGYGHWEDTDASILRVRTLFPFGKGGEFRLANIFSLKLYKFIAAYRPDIIHVHHPFWLGSVGLFLGKRFNIPVVYTYHTRLEHYSHYVPLPGPLFRNLIAHAVVKRFANRCNGVIVPTQSVEEYLRMIGVTRPIFVQPTGIDFKAFQAVDASTTHRLKSELGLQREIVLVSVSRLSKEKNIDFMFDALKTLRDRCSRPFKLLLIGDGPERKHLQTRIDDEGLADHIVLVGAIQPGLIPQYYHLADLFVFASLSETQGMVILEAMAAGLPAVVVRASGIDDVVHDEFNGLKTPLSLERWSQGIERLINDARLRQDLATNAREFAAQHDIEMFSQQIAKVYATIFAEKAYFLSKQTKHAARQ